MVFDYEKKKTYRKKNPSIISFKIHILANFEIYGIWLWVKNVDLNIFYCL